MATDLGTTEATVRLAAFALVFALVAVWEALAPRREQRVGRRRWPANLSLSALNSAFLRVAVPLGAYGTAGVAAARGWGFFNLVDLHPGAELVLAVLLMDLTIYLQHRVFHAVPLLWRFHALHHADNEFDVTTGLRFHTLSMLVSMGVKMAATVLLGVSPAAVVTSETALNVTAMFNHGNIRMPAALDRVLRRVVVTPDMHRVHHSVSHDEHSHNFGFNFPWWDRLLGTYRDQPVAGHRDMAIGLDEYQGNQRQGLLWILAEPFRRKPSPSLKDS
jgi:sterol desaturase/sphingolipid hydroxylase (fatty acid hydroxylase superfamily)